ncbi:MAG: phospholipid transport system substrate-binding protein [Lentimonas sp.]|jgi:phospholipid transport system substrate-binding protein
MNFLSIIACLAFLLVGAPVYSQGSEAEKLEHTMGAALDLLYLDDYKEYTYAQKQSAVQVLLEQNYDLTVIIRRALARNWGLMSAEEQMRVTDLIKELIVKAYVEGMAGFGRPSIACGEIIEITSKRIEIPVVISFPDGDVFNVLYRLGRLQTGWQLYDIVGEDISMVSNYRQQFDDHFRKGNGQQLIEKLEELLSKGELDENTKI